MNPRAAIAQAGGLCTVADLAARWGVSRQRADQLVRYPGFPEPIRTEGGTALYLTSEADAWRSVKRRPGPKTTSTEGNH